MHDINEQYETAEDFIAEYSSLLSMHGKNVSCEHLSHNIQHPLTKADVLARVTQYPDSLVNAWGDKISRPVFFCARHWEE